MRARAQSHRFARGQLERVSGSSALFRLAAFRDLDCAYDLLSEPIVRVEKNARWRNCGHEQIVQELHREERRPAYEGASTVNLDASVDLHYRLNDHHSIIAAFKYRAFGSEIKDSPLIDASGSPRMNVGYLYRF